MNLLFHCKNQLFRPFLQPNILKARHFVIEGVRQPKNFRVRPPLFSNNEKKIFQNWQVWDLNPHPYLASNYASCTQPIEPPTLSHINGSEKIFKRELLFLQVSERPDQFYFEIFSEDNAKSCYNIFNLLNLFNKPLI